MKKITKKIMVELMATAMAISLSACGSGDSKEATMTAAGVQVAGAESLQGRSIRVLAPEELGSKDALSDAIDKWVVERGVKMERITTPHDDQLTKFPAMVKNKDLPDLIQTTRLHQLYPEEFVDTDTIVDLGLFEESALKTVGRNYELDKIPGPPSQLTITSIYYNIDTFEKVDIEAPTVDNPWTWDELYENAAKLQAPDDVEYGLVADVSRARHDILTYANGDSLVVQDDDIFKVNVNYPANVSTLETSVKVNEDDVMPKAIWIGGFTDDLVEYFKNGDAVILLPGSWNCNSMTTDTTKFRFGVMPSPKGTSSQAAIIGGSTPAIPEDVVSEDVAVTFVKRFYTEGNFKEYSQNDKSLFSLKNVVYEPNDEKAAADHKILQSEVSYVMDTFTVDESSA